MLKVGITGGIGSGKSTVCSMLEKSGIPIFYSDKEAQTIINNDPEVRSRIVALLGDRAYTESGMDRKWVGSIVFNDTEKLEGLNTIMRPAVRQSFDAWANEQVSNIVGMEAAILIESGGHKNMDHIIVVTAPMDVRIERTMKRDGCTREEVLLRIAAQMDEQEKLSYANTVITNTGDINDLDRQVNDVCLRLKELSEI